MGWSLGDDELQRVLALGVDARFAYTLSKIREHGELWTLTVVGGGWLTGDGSGGEKSIPVWPHERFAQLEATGAWAGGTPARVSLVRDWLTSGRAAWFEEHEVRIEVFRARGAAMVASYAAFAEHLRSEPRERYLRSRKPSGVAPRPRLATRVTRDLVDYVDQGDVDVVIARVPAELRARLRDVFFYSSVGAKILGSVSRRGRRDVNLSARLPIRVSLRGYMRAGRSAAEFGAPKRGQWPPWAVRRYLLYGTLLHELGHLQVVDGQARIEARQ